MNTFRNRLRRGLAATWLLTSLGTAAVAQGFVGGFSGEYTGGWHSPLQINGSVVCSDCRLEDVQRAHPQEKDLYQFSTKHGALVFKVASVNDPATFNAVVWPQRLWLRASDEVLQQLAAEDTLFKPIGLTGILGTARTLDVTEVAISR
jgi:hypothetical protein